MNLNEDYDMILKIILIGDSGVGKTNILSQYLKKQFNQDSLATVGVEFGSKIVEIEKVKIKAQIWDTAGQERYRSITTSYYKGAKGAFIVYDVTRFSSFETVERWISELKNATEEKISIVMIGNKIDLKNNREVKTEDGEAKAISLGISFFETSAMDYKSVDRAFVALLTNIYYQSKTKNISKTKEQKDKIALGKSDSIDVNNKNKQKKKKCNCK